MFSPATLFLWLASIMAMFVNYVIGQQIVDNAEEVDATPNDDTEYNQEFNESNKRNIMDVCNIL